MDKVQRAQEFFDALNDTARAEGLDLVDVEVKGQAHNPIVVVYLDKHPEEEGAQGGIGIDDLTQANKWISSTLDELIATRYTLEVSSPGGRPKRSTADSNVDKAAGNTT